MDELVQSVVCYNPRPIIFHGYLAPFFVIQAAVYYYFSQDASSNSTAINLDSDSNGTNTDSDETNQRHSYEIAVIAVTVSVVAQAIAYLFCHWSVDVECWLSYSRCKDPFNSKFAKVTPTPNNGSTELVPLRRETIAKKPIVWFMFQKTKYVYDDKSNQFVQIHLSCDRKISYYKNWKGYSDPNEMQLVDKQYGHNELEMVIPEFKELFIERATAPFFVFQTFSVGLWFLDKFWYYALFTLFMLITWEVVVVKHQLRNMQEIRRMGNQPFIIQVFRQNKWKPIKTDQLIPGDLVSLVRSDHNIPCDILLIRGSCIIDESTLTGESVPQMKEPIEDIDNDDRQLDVNQDKLHVIFGGTKILQHATPGKEPGCIGYVLRTGFHTSQGKLLRTILFGVKRVTANNFETFCFIMFLLVFALMSAYYVWTKGIEDPKRSRYRLFFECTVIITSVVPPELPIELSLAVNTSLLSLSKLFIYCTEPFRIPFAGKVEYCCFDKTGTLTSDDLIVEGVAGLTSITERKLLNDVNDVSQNPIESTIDSTGSIVDSKSKSPPSSLKSSITRLSECPPSTVQVLASCHSLVHLDEKLVGDPLEKKVLEAINWNYSKSGTATPKKGRILPLKIHQRYHFNSTLKRMSVIASYKLDMTNDNIYICTAKGAPEFMRPLMKEVPDNYNEVYMQMSRLGARVLALGFRTIGLISLTELAAMKREEAEKDLMFAGFLVISCPLKPDSKAVCRELSESGHRLVMITGDGALTACHVASVLNFTTKDVLILNKENEETNPSIVKNCSSDNWNWISTDQKVNIPFEETVCNFIEFSRDYDLCLTGDSLNFIYRNQKENVAYDIISRVKVFARVSPKQKEYIITSLKSRGKTVLMCGDGTNDVGALKHAQVGVALLSSGGLVPIKNINVTNENTKPLRPKTEQERLLQQRARAQAKLKELMDEQDQPQFVKLGDASIAAPFTSRLSSTKCVSHIIKQGRCTLVTTLQMFKILALNALLSAYCHSVLYLDGIKFSDGQLTTQGLLGTFCFLFIAKSQPLDRLSAQKPLPNIFNLYTILTVTFQFAVHFSSLIFLYSQAKIFQDQLDFAANATLSAASSSLTTIETKNSSLTNTTGSDDPDGMDGEFEPSLINSTVYIIWMSVQLATFAVNYKGHPFRQDLRSNRPLCYSFIGSALVVFACVNGWSASLIEQLSVVEFPYEFQTIVMGVIVMDLVSAFVIDRLCEYLFGRLVLAPL